LDIICFLFWKSIAKFIRVLLRSYVKTSIEKIHAVIGGCNLTGAKPERIQKTLADTKAIGPDYIVPTHYTGFAAFPAFAQALPNQFILNTAGTKYTISQ
jgi:7,8-dihydropterin-6-yl-methyl-4-(beta-D-ribofuranosyl)aminobenzene 5'-phosphate synthase